MVGVRSAGNHTIPKLTKYSATIHNDSSCSSPDDGESRTDVQHSATFLYAVGDEKCEELLEILLFVASAVQNEAAPRIDCVTLAASHYSRLVAGGISGVRSWTSSCVV